MIAETITRLKTQVPTLRTVEDAASLTALLKTGQPPHRAPAAYVVPTGAVAQPPIDISGGHLQELTETISVVLFLTTPSGAGAGRSEGFRALLLEIVQALAGWPPVPEAGPLFLRRYELRGLEGGVAVYELSFAFSQALRII